MHSLMKKLEHFTDRIIPFLLIILAIILIIEFFFKGLAKTYHSHILFADALIIFFFTLDLLFKYNRIRNIKFFFRKYWLDIIAIFPFFLLFRLIEEVALLLRIPDFTEGQKFLHIGLETEKLAREERALRELVELQRETQLTRTRLFSRFFRIPRFVKIFPFYEKPIKKEINIIKKDFKKIRRKVHKRKSKS